MTQPEPEIRHQRPGAVRIGPQRGVRLGSGAPEQYGFEHRFCCPAERGRQRRRLCRTTRRRRFRKQQAAAAAVPTQAGAAGRWDPPPPHRRPSPPGRSRRLRGRRVQGRPGRGRAVAAARAPARRSRAAAEAVAEPQRVVAPRHRLAAVRAGSSLQRRGTLCRGTAGRTTDRPITGRAVERTSLPPGSGGAIISTTPTTTRTGSGDPGSATGSGTCTSTRSGTAASGTATGIPATAAMVVGAGRLWLRQPGLS